MKALIRNKTYCYYLIKEGKDLLSKLKRGKSIHVDVDGLLY